MPRDVGSRPAPATAIAGGTGAPRPMRFDRLTTEDGLSQGTVNCTLQDDTGLLWIGTQGGLNRYDGYRFEVYRHDELPFRWSP